ncbi:MAG: hypothetical protein KJ057_12995 [Phycisphaerae bacterium]|nr:MAG: hypothetical protein EDS66_16535 [Planctomycetota bacterium]MBE7457422.1 hypothetical protein [Planctomycetia bacterium]MCL4719381.1 hypothetical protein [Phycisphaerae bacterium]
MKTITFEAIELPTASEAMQHYYASGYGDRVIAVNGKYYLVKRAEAERLESAGVEFAYVVDHDLPDGRNVIMTVPVN